MDNEFIIFKDVRKSYVTSFVKTEVLKGINFSVYDGEFLIILGASGAGKSTVLNMIGGMDRPDSGNIIFNGTDIAKYNDKQLREYRAKHIGFVFQFYNLIPNLNVLENVKFASEVKNDTLDPIGIIKDVGLESKMKQFPATLSGGEQQRVAIARAIAKNPSLLLCDEPTGALDYATSKKVLHLLENLNQTKKKTIVLITHNEAIASMADRIVKIQDGQVKSIEINKNKTSVMDLEW